MVTTPVESDVNVTTGPDPEVPQRTWVRHHSPAYKLRVLQEYETLDKARKGALLRREGLYSSLIAEWRRQRDCGAAAGLAQGRGRPQADPRDRELARLHKQMAKLELELDKAKKVIEIQSKLSARVPRQASTNRRVRVRAALRGADSAESSAEWGRRALRARSRGSSASAPHVRIVYQFVVVSSGGDEGGGSRDVEMAGDAGGDRLCVRRSHLVGRYASGPPHGKRQEGGYLSNRGELQKTLRSPR